MEDSNEFVELSYIIPEFMESLMVTFGPMNPEEASRRLRENRDVHLRVDGVKYEPPEVWVEELLAKDNRFTIDDSGRYHLVGGKEVQSQE